MTIEIGSGTLPNFDDILKDVSQRMGVQLQGFIGREMGDRAISESYRAGASSQAFDDSTAKNRTNQLRTASGRLYRSFGVRNNAPETPDGIYAVVIDRNGLVITIGTKVEYAAVHEYGGTMPSRFVKSKGRMDKFFWAKYYATKDKKYMYAAIKVLQHGGINIKSYNMPARPYFYPGLKSFQDEAFQQAGEYLFDKIMQRLSQQP